MTLNVAANSITAAPMPLQLPNGSWTRLHSYSLVVDASTYPVLETEFSNLAGSSADLIWLHQAGGMLGFNPLLRLEATGQERFAELAEAQQNLAASAQIVDEAQVFGSALLAFASFSYSPSSNRHSTLIYPELLLAKVEQQLFFTLTSLSEITREQATARLAQLLKKLEAEIQATPVLPEFSFSVSAMHSPGSYQHLVAAAVQKIRESVAQKIVLSERFTVDLEGVTTRQIRSRLTQKLNAYYPGAWTFAISELLGSSPEMLIRVHSGRAFSRVLAGSRPVADGAGLSLAERETFSTDAKELEEHEYAMQSVLAPLTAFSTKISVSPQPYVLQLPGIEHLASDLHAQLAAEANIFAILAALHPSAAVSGTPRKVADQQISELEAQDRGGYAAPVGWVNSAGDGEFAIALRMAHLKSESFTIHAGGGLVKDSDPLVEHAEVLAKTRPLLRALEQLQQEN